MDGTKTDAETDVTSSRQDRDQSQLSVMSYCFLIPFSPSIQKDSKDLAWSFLEELSDALLTRFCEKLSKRFSKKCYQKGFPDQLLV